MAGRLALVILLVTGSVWAQEKSPREAITEVLNEFFRLVDLPPPKMKIGCLNTIRHAEFALEDFKRDYPGEYPEVVRALGDAMVDYDHGCRALGRGAPATWKRAAQHVFRAEETFAKTIDTPAIPSPPEKQNAPPSEGKPQEAEQPKAEKEKPKEAEQTAETSAQGDEPSAEPAAVSTKNEEPPSAKPSVSPIPSQPGDPETVRKAREVLAQVQKLASAVDLALEKSVQQDRLIDAHAAVEDFATLSLSQNIPLAMGSLRVAIAYYRRSLDTNDSFAVISGKNALQKAREYLNNYEATGREEPLPGS